MSSLVSDAVSAVEQGWEDDVFLEDVHGTRGG